MGSALHKVMEVLALCKKRKDEGLEYVIEEPELDLKIYHDFDFFQEENIDYLLDKSIIYYLKDFDTAKADIRNVKQWTRDALSYSNGMYDPRKQKIFAAEQHFDLIIDKPWAKYDFTLRGERITGNLSIKGTIDLIVEEDDNVIHIIDYKSGQRLNYATGQPKTYDDFMDDTQLMLYYYAVRRLYPDKCVIFTIYWIRDGGPFTLCFDDEHLDIIENRLKKTFKEVLDNKNPKMKSPNHTHFWCTKVCGYYKQNWEGSDKNICRYVADHIKEHGIDVTTEELMASGHKLDKYQAPGA